MHSTFGKIDESVLYYTRPAGDIVPYLMMIMHFSPDRMMTSIHSVRRARNADPRNADAVHHAVMSLDALSRLHIPLKELTSSDRIALMISIDPTVTLPSDCHLIPVGGWLAARSTCWLI